MPQKKQSATPAPYVATTAPAPESDILDLDSAAALLRVPPRTIYAWTRSRSNVSIPFRRLGKFLRFSRTDLLTWFATLGSEKNVGKVRS